MISTLNIEDLLKSAQPEGEPRGGRYIHREWTGERWKYTYVSDRAAAHGFHAVHDFKDKTFSHTLEAVAERVSGDPETDYKTAVQDAFKNPDTHMSVANPQGGEDLILNLIQATDKRGPLLRLQTADGEKVKEFKSRDAFVLWYLGVSNTTVFMDHAGIPMLEVRPLIGSIKDDSLVPGKTKTTKTLTSGEIKEYEANNWQVTYHKDYPEDKRVNVAQGRWLKSSRAAAEAHVRKLVRDQAITAKVDLPTPNENEQKAVESAKASSFTAAPGSVADKIQSGKLKWRLSSDKKRELDATQGEKDALIAQAAKEYYPLIMTLANQMASNEYLTRDFRANLYTDSGTGKGAWIARFLGSDVPKHLKDKLPDFIFPDPESPTYQAIDHALNTYDPAMGASFTGYLTGKQGILYWKMRQAQDKFIAEVKGTDGAVDEAKTVAADDSDESEGMSHFEGAEAAAQHSDVSQWREAVGSIMEQWKNSPELESEKRVQIEDLLGKFDQLDDDEKSTYMPRVHSLMSQLISWRAVLGKSLALSAVEAMKQDLLEKAAQPQAPQMLTRNKQVDPTHEYSHMEGQDENPRYYYRDQLGNLVRYSNAPMGHGDRSSQYGEAELHPSEPQFQTNPEYFTPDGRKLSRAPDVDPTTVVWNDKYNQFDPKNMWIGQWVDPLTGTPQFTYLDADLRTYPKLRIHQQNAITDTRIEDLRNMVVALFQSDKIKDQMTALALILLDQGKMRAIEITSLTPHDIIIEGSIVTVGSRKMYCDQTVITAFEILKRHKNHEEPLFTVPLQKQDGDIDQEASRRIGPNYLSAVLEQLGLSLLGLQTYHATIRFVREMSKLMYQYKVQWDAAVQQAMLAVVLEWGHDFTNEMDAVNVIQLAQAALIDPIVIEVLQEKAEEAKLFDDAQVAFVPEPSIPMPFVSIELTGKTLEEQAFSQWIHSAAIHEYAGDNE